MNVSTGSIVEPSRRTTAPLKSLELQGYKTFASKTVFEFGRTITAIVGPNGSGKSNIADAIRWVLGEQSYTLLRGKKTEDMIFSGSESRPRASMAAATITFDNSNGWLPIDFAEVTISRRAYRDGQNEYLLNGQRVRLREVAELLAQVGLAQRTYTIIGQGLVDAALSLKAEERRRLFEEAAGIGLYRARRDEALRRLEATRRNLERVQDILAELRPRLRSLERQAQRAREYEQVKADLEGGLRQWYGFHWHQMGRVVAEARAEAEALTETRDNLRQALASVEGQLSATRSRIDLLRSNLQQLSQQVSTLYGQREVLGTRLAVAQERLRWLQEQASQIRAELGSLEEGKTALAERLEAARKEAETRRQAMEAAEEGRRLTLEAGPRSAMVRLQEAGKALEELASRKASWSAKVAQLEAQARELSNRRAGLQSETETARARLGEAQAEVETARRQLAAAEGQRQAAASAEAGARRSLSEAEAQQTALSRRVSDLRAHTAGLEARLEVLVRHEGEAEEAAGRLIEAADAGRLAGLAGRLSQHLHPAPEHETAIASALGDFGDGLALRTMEDVASALDWLDAIDGDKQAVLLPLSALRELPPRHQPSGPECIGNASDLAGAEAVFRPIVDRVLGRTLVVRDRAGARRLLPSLPADGRVVTLAGEIFYAAGHVVVGRGARRSARREQARGRTETQLLEARKALADVEAAHARAAAEAELARARVGEAVRVLESALETERATRHAAEKAEGTRQAGEREHEVLAARVPEVGAEIARLEGERAQLMGLEASLASEHVRVEAELRAASEAVQVTQEGEAVLREAQAEARLQAARQGLEDARGREAELLDRIALLEGDLTLRRSRLEVNDRERESLGREVAEGGEAIRGVEARLAAIASQTSPSETALAEAEQQRSELEAVESQARSDLQSAERGHSQAQIELARRQEEMNSLKRRIQDDFGLVAFDYDENTTGQAPLPFEGLVERLPVVDSLPLEVETEVERLRAQLRRMGAINPEAQREYTDVRQRTEFLMAQVDDLRRAESQLHEVIAELDLLMEREFRKTFDAVAVAFRETFTQLFGGGVARLRLTDPDDLTTTGIEIEARLPGRREQGLAVLSGGERSLTACALVFALLRVSPTPVCVLDEVDAMLDEANVARFRVMLRSLSERTQFIVITHNRETVQAAEVVYGVTMGRDSASTVISLKLDEAARRVTS